MAGYVKHFVGHEYPNGDYKLAPEATDGIKVGGFVAIDHTEKEFDVPTGDVAGSVYFVDNETDYLVSANQDERNFLVNAGDFVKAKPVIDGEMFVTDMFEDGVAVGDMLAVGTGGELLPIATLTASDFTTFEAVFVVTELVTHFGLSMIIVVANTKQKTA